MSNIYSPAAPGQVVSLARPPQYWRRRAEQHRRRGEHHRAAALLRHAVALDPACGDLRMEYARALRDMNCYEASTREAFGVLALEPSGFAAYQIIGRNMLSLGREQEAIDAFSHYLDRAWSQSQPLMIHPEDDEFYALEDLLHERPTRGRARLDTLCHIGSQRLVRGDVNGAKKALARADRLGSMDERYHTLSAMLCDFLDQPEEALAHAQAAVWMNPWHVPSLCALASVCDHQNARGQAAAILMKAAFFCRFPHDEQLYCFTVIALEMPELALAMLRLSKHKHPDRLPTLYNYAVTLLCLGKLEQALGYLHRCLYLDPEDLAVQTLFRQAQQWESQALPEMEVRQKAEALGFYPFLPPEAVERLLTELADAFEQGVEAFSHRLILENGLYRAFLHALSLPDAPLPRLIGPIAKAMAEESPACAERLLRDILMQGLLTDLPKRHALSALIALEAKPPYVIWQNGRILQLAPTGEVPPRASALQRHLHRRVGRAARLVDDPRLIPHTLELLHRMSRRFRYAFAADRNRVWTHALLRHYALSHASGPFPGIVDDRDEKPALAERIDRAFQELCKLMPLPK